MFNLPDLSVPIWIFLYVYGAYMLFYVLYSLFNIYHLIRYGVYGFGLYLLVTIFTGGTILLLTGSFFLLSEYNWNELVSVNGILKNESSGLFPDL
jgi:hypothetical protein